MAAAFVLPRLLDRMDDRHVMLIGAGLMVLQGLAEVLRCAQCLRDGQWTARMHDVEELENQILAEAARKRAAEGVAA